MKFLLVLSIALFSSFTYSLGWDDIDWASCGPSGIQRRIKLASDPKVFWASQYTTLESILEVNSLEYDGRKQDCYLRNQNSETKYVACVMRLDVQMQNIYRCLKHSASMCRNYGGYC